MDRVFSIIEAYSMLPPVNIQAIFNALGVEYRTEPMAPGESGRIEKVKDHYRVTVNSNEGAMRQRFTAAHELAHFVLHRDLLETRHLDRLFDPSPDSNPSAPFTPQHEVQANRMAASILMPKSRVLVQFKETTDVKELAKKFLVSPAAMKIRLKSLGLEQ